jgi:hypothetical protein
MFGDSEMHLRYIREGMPEHQALHLGIYQSAPVAAGEEGLANRNPLMRDVVGIPR